MSRGRHPKSPVAAALAAARSQGLVVSEDHNGHRWGHIICPNCLTLQTIWSTPRNPDAHAARISRFVNRHRHAVRGGDHR